MVSCSIFFIDALAHLLLGSVTDLFPHSGNPILLATPDPEFVFTQDRLGLSVNQQVTFPLFSLSLLTFLQGVATRQNYTFTSEPSVMCDAKPYLLSLISDGVHVHDQTSGKLAQVVPLKGSRSFALALPFSLCRRHESRSREKFYFCIFQRFYCCVTTSSCGRSGSSFTVPDDFFFLFVLYLIQGEKFHQSWQSKDGLGSIHANCTKGS